MTNRSFNRPRKEILMAILTPADIVDIGIEKEKKRRDFYGLAADHFSEQEELSSLFGRLRDWEEEHIRKFQEIRSTVSGGSNVEEYPGELEAYMQAVVDSDLYSDITPESFANEVKTPQEALDRGISFEKDAILFFSGLSRFLESDMKDVVKTLIKEEQQHMVYLSDMKREISEA
jgi:rubrerythrin